VLDELSLKGLGYDMSRTRQRPLCISTIDAVGLQQVASGVQRRRIILQRLLGIGDRC
jgi:hypothetical protein